jgi:hypothetical protein
MKNRVKCLFIITLILLSIGCTKSQDETVDKTNEQLLWYDEPAVEWTEALPWVMALWGEWCSEGYPGKGFS